MYSKITHDKKRKYVDQAKVIMALQDAIIAGKLESVSKVVAQWRKELNNNDKYNEKNNVQSSSETITVDADV